MLRLRLASMAVACGFLFTLSGCYSTCEDGRLFPRLFRSNYAGSGGMMGPQGECECHSSHMPGMPPLPSIMDSASLPGPQLKTQPGWNANMPIPITNIPANQPPNLFKVPQAQPTPYNPTN